jgi:acyl dehydratase
VSLDPSLVGRSYPPSPPYHVGREKIREFADAIGAPDAAHRDPAAAQALGYPDVVAPPTFPIAITLPASQPIIDELGIEFAKVVHGDQRFAYVRPIVAGDELRCVIHIDEVMSRGGHTFLTLKTDVSDAAGAAVVSVWTRLVVRGDA